MKTPHELVQFVRTLTTAQLTTELEKTYANDPDLYIIIENFFKSAKENNK